MKALKWFVTTVIVAVLSLSAVALVACGGGNSEEETTTYTVTYYDSDATTVLKTEEVEEGGYATEWTPEKDGYTFSGWYATPNSSNFAFDFTAAITDDTSVFAMWASATQSEDTRTYYIVGYGTSPVLSQSNWGAGLGDASLTDLFKMTKAEDENVYTYTVDLYEGDQFQFAINSDWYNQRGYGYLTETTLDDGTAVFSSSSTIGSNAAYRLNINVLLTGNYTFTLTTHPDDDLYEDGYEGNEVYNYNPLDTIEWTYNGDPVGDVEIEITPTYYIKGSGISSWYDMYNDFTQMTETSEGIYELEIYLAAEEEFMFASYYNNAGVATALTYYIYYSNLDEESKELFNSNASGNNMITIEAGQYKFIYDSEADVLSATVDTDYVSATYTYCLDGEIAATETTYGAFHSDFDSFALTNTEGTTYVIENVELTAGDEIVIRGFLENTDTTTSWGDVTYNYVYLATNPSFSQPTGGTNIYVEVSGTYNISFDSYSHIITITAVGQAYDIYMSSSMQDSWDPAYDTQYLFTQSEDDENVYTLKWTFAIGDQFGLRVFPEGAADGDGQSSTWVGVSAGDTDDVTATFTSESASNFQCTVAGTYILSYNVSTGVLTISFAG